MYSLSLLFYICIASKKFLKNARKISCLPGIDRNTHMLITAFPLLSYYYFFSISLACVW